MAKTTHDGRGNYTRTDVIEVAVDRHDEQIYIRLSIASDWHTSDYEVVHCTQILGVEVWPEAAPHSAAYSPYTVGCYTLLGSAALTPNEAAYAERQAEGVADDDMATESEGREPWADDGQQYADPRDFLAGRE